MSLGQLYPHGHRPLGRHRHRRLHYGPGFDFTSVDPPRQHLHRRLTLRRQPGRRAEGTPALPRADHRRRLQPARQHRATTAPTPTARLIGALAGVGALQQIDCGCGPTGKLVCDAAAIADPEIDYSDYDTDKDGVVDFFMAVFAGCGGNGASQLARRGCDYTDARRTTTSGRTRSSLEYYYTDPATGLPGYTTDDQLKDLEGRPLWYTDDTYARA